MRRTIAILTFPALLILYLIVVLSLLLWASTTMAHELWVLTPEQTSHWSCACSLTTGVG